MTSAEIREQIASLSEMDILDQHDLHVSSPMDDPYPAFRELREKHGVYEGDILKDLFDLPFSVANPSGERPVFSVLRYDDVVTVLRDHRTYSSTIYEDTVGRVQGKNMLMIDPPEHTRLRALLGPNFTSSRMAAWRDDVVVPLLNEHFIDGFIADGRADLLRQLALSYPVMVIHQVLGLPRETADDLNRIALGLLLIASRPDIARACSAALTELLRTNIARHRAHAESTLIDSLIAARGVDGDAPLDDEEILNFLRLLLPAGGETTTKNLSCLLVGLLTHPDQLDLLRRTPELLPNAIEEALRWEAPSAIAYRVTTCDTELGGVRIPAGAGVNVCLAAANHDESRFANPDAFDITRPPARHMSFAFGPHMCIGMNLARMEVEAAVSGLLRRLPNLRLDPDAAPPVIRGGTFRWATSVPAVWDQP
jgi:cytochrome P450